MWGFISLVLCFLMFAALGFGGGWLAHEAHQLDNGDAARIEAQKEFEHLELTGREEAVREMVRQAVIRGMRAPKVGGEF